VREAIATAHQPRNSSGRAATFNAVNSLNSTSLAAALIGFGQPRGPGPNSGAITVVCYDPLVHLRTARPISGQQHPFHMHSRNLYPTHPKTNPSCPLSTPSSAMAGRIGHADPGQPSRTAHTRIKPAHRRLSNTPSTHYTHNTAPRRARPRRPAGPLGTRPTPPAPAPAPASQTPCPAPAPRAARVSRPAAGQSRARLAAGGFVGPCDALRCYFAAPASRARTYC
jgi:hypothetical protein